MTPVRFAFALAVLLGLLAAWAVDIDTDARRLLGENNRAAAALDTVEGRSLTLAVIGPDRDKRTELASQIAADLPDHPLVSRVTSAPGAPSPTLLDWLWLHRFVLAPPAPAAFTPDSLVSEMRRARAALVSASGGELADRYLRDPVGSFRRIVAALASASETALPIYRSVFQARDDSAALIFIELRDMPFDVAAQIAFDASLRQRVSAGGAEALLIGPRTVSAEISDRISTRSKMAAVVASALLLLWLGFIVRPVSAVFTCLLPLALGFGTAVLLVQAVFGSVHVLALGFGGALLGLAMDYPLHLLAHRAEFGQNNHARRYVAIGAATTAIAFLALLGSGIPAIEQVGLFVAAGLSVAAAAAIWLAGSTPPADLRTLAPVKRPFVFARKLPVLAAFTLAGTAVLWQLPGQTIRGLVEVSPRIAGSIERLGTMVDLPSGRYRIDVTGATLTEVLTRQADLANTLQAAGREGLVGRFEMLGSFLPEGAASPDFPSPGALSVKLAGLLVEAGLAPDFRGEIVSAYREGLEASSPGPEALLPLNRVAAISGLIRAEGDTLRAPVRLWGVYDPERLARAVADLGQDNIIFIDQQKSIAYDLEKLSARVTLWLAAGVIAGLLFLSLAVRRPMAVAEIALGCLAAGLATALLASLLTGGLGVFHIVALTLVVGIGIDYGIFLTLSENDEQYRAAMRSVLLCAGTTLIAFITMALSGVNVLVDIGMTVSIGVIAMVGVNLVRRTISAPSEEK